MKRVLLVGLLAVASCNDPAKKDDSPDPDPVGDGGAGDVNCNQLTSYFKSSCADHLQISDDTSACAPLVGGPDEAPFEKTRAVALEVCAGAAGTCDDIFVCLADEHGLSATTAMATVTGKATVEGDDFTFDAKNAWAYLATKTDGKPGDLAVLFQHQARPWYFKLEDFAERATQKPFLVDADHPIKLENYEDNVELVTGSVAVASFSADGTFNVRATGTDAATGESIDVTVRGKFTSMAK